MNVKCVSLLMKNTTYFGDKPLSNNASILIFEFPFMEINIFVYVQMDKLLIFRCVYSVTFTVHVAHIFGNIVGNFRDMLIVITLMRYYVPFFAQFVCILSIYFMVS